MFASLTAVVVRAAILSTTSANLTILKPTQLPPYCASPGSQTVTSTRDAWIDQNSPTSNKDTDANLRVKSQDSNRNRRTLVGFTLPSLPANCAVTSATLRLFNNHLDAGRTIAVYRAASSWTEAGVTWSNAPATTGSAVNATTAAGWMTWTVTTHVQAMYVTNDGFIVRDANEDNAGAIENQFDSRENTDDPQLIVQWA